MHTNARYQKGKLWGGEGTPENSVLSAQFFHKTKTSLKKKKICFLPKRLLGRSDEALGGGNQGPSAPGSARNFSCQW